MKHLLSAILGLACVGLAVSLLMSNRSHNAQHELDAEAITEGSNQLFSAQSSARTEIAAWKKALITYSNLLETCQSGSLTVSNQLVEAKSAGATAKEQIAALNQQITQSEAEKQALSQRIEGLTNQIAVLTNHIASTRASLVQAYKDYALLENRFRRDVAERLVVERKFNNRSELKAQMEYLMLNPAVEISADRIREGLNVVVKSNMCYVIAPE